MVLTDSTNRTNRKIKFKHLHLMLMKNNISRTKVRDKIYVFTFQCAYEQLILETHHKRIMSRHAFLLHDRLLKHDLLHKDFENYQQLLNLFH
jgi:hypothetical protein